jgi:hypothetical protein
LILVSSSHLGLGLRNGIFPSGFPTKILQAFFISPMSATCPDHFFILVDLIIVQKYSEEKSKNYADFSLLLSRHPFWVHTLS